MSKKLHLVSFDVPYPPNYGGIIDVFYKIKALHALGIKIYLHTFEYGKGEQEALNNYCENVYYYPRNSFFKSYISKTPFIVKTRENSTLISNLKAIIAPILFEGLHTTSALLNTTFSNQKIAIRTHNIEHDFYKGLAKSEENLVKKSFFYHESKKLKKYEKIVKKADAIFTISPFEQDYFLAKYGEKSIYIPAFHQVVITEHQQTKGTFILYHGNLQVSENVHAALFLIDIYKNSEFRLVIASSNQHKKVSAEISKHQNITFSTIHHQSDLEILFENAHVNVLPTFQKTGIKLKLLNTLYQGKFIICNKYMIEDTGLEVFVEKANTKDEFLQKTATLFTKNFTQKMTENRLRALQNFNPEESAQKIIAHLF